MFGEMQAATGSSHSAIGIVCPPQHWAGVWERLVTMLGVSSSLNRSRILLQSQRAHPDWLCPHFTTIQSADQRAVTVHKASIPQAHKGRAASPVCPHKHGRAVQPACPCPSAIPHAQSLACACMLQRTHALLSQQPTGGYWRHSPAKHTLMTPCAMKPCAMKPCARLLQPQLEYSLCTVWWYTGAPRVVLTHSWLPAVVHAAALVCPNTAHAQRQPLPTVSTSCWAN
jgi:hypothetical protein